jgi:surface antigen
LTIITIFLLSICLSTFVQAADYGQNIGSFWGITAYSNGQYTGTGNGKYQCVEYVKRFYDTLTDIDVSKWTGNASTYDNKPGLTFYSNGSYFIPQPGDILVFSGGNYGHVAIVMSFSTSTGQLQMIHQNWSKDTAYKTITAQLRWEYKSTIFYLYVTIPAMGSYTCKGWSRPSLRLAAPAIEKKQQNKAITWADLKRAK